MYLLRCSATDPTCEQVNRAEAFLQFSQQQTQEGIGRDGSQICRVLIVHHYFLFAVDFNLRHVIEKIQGIVFNLVQILPFYCGSSC